MEKNNGTWILLIRGINVGGRNRLKMDDLTDILESHGLDDINTYIQSGNVVFRSDTPITSDLANDIAASIEEQHGFRPQTLLFSAGELDRAIKANPFHAAAEEPKSLHLFFLDSEPVDPDLKSLSDAQSETERYHLSRRVFYLHAPDGIGRSKLASNAEKYLGVPATARNWRTVQKLSEMAGT